QLIRRYIVCTKVLQDLCCQRKFPVVIASKRKNIMNLRQTVIPVWYKTELNAILYLNFNLFFIIDEFRFNLRCLFSQNGFQEIRLCITVDSNRCNSVVIYPQQVFVCPLLLVYNSVIIFKEAVCKFHNIFFGNGFISVHFLKFFLPSLFADVSLIQVSSQTISSFKTFQSLDFEVIDYCRQ